MEEVSDILFVSSPWQRFQVVLLKKEMFIKYADAQKESCDDEIEDANFLKKMKNVVDVAKKSQIANAKEFSNVFPEKSEKKRDSEPPKKKLQELKRNQKRKKIQS
jgi:hypothetical protein